MVLNRTKAQAAAWSTVTPREEEEEAIQKGKSMSTCPSGYVTSPLNKQQRHVAFSHSEDNKQGSRAEGGQEEGRRRAGGEQEEGRRGGRRGAGGGQEGGRRRAGGGQEEGRRRASLTRSRIQSEDTPITKRLRGQLLFTLPRPQEALSLQGAASSFSFLFEGLFVPQLH
ncbi:hypothetical protein EYF80_041336 [Liparis tanakae]|uniref:Uncharacterized protein n=1 Tax=Liparis tanakae TaxID=230148 RepID=A0A4Z2G7C0_9TELE|nr:hypothetical protein EYF80_041336 [Liparis tanakae]